MALYFLSCGCGYKRKTDGTDLHDLVQMKLSSDPQKNVPKLEGDKFTEIKYSKQTPKFKCPKCGRLIVPKKKYEEPKQESDYFGY